MAPADLKSDNRGDPGLTNRFMGSIPLWLSSSHTKDIKNGSGPCLNGTQDEVGTKKHNWSALCQYNGLGGLACWPMTCYPSEVAI